MKRTIFITIGSIILLLIFGVWVYLLLFGAPKEVNEAFTNLGFGSFTPIEEDQGSLEQTAQLNINNGNLSQLTTRPVAGFAFLATTGSSTEKLRYAERGTGYVFEIDLLSGVETRVSAKTHLAVTDAYFSPDGNAVVLISETDSGLEAELEELGDRERSHSLPTNATNLHFSSSTELRYLLPTSGGSTGYVYNLDEMTTDELFFLPLTDISLSWGVEETVFYNHAAPWLRGGLYRINNNELTLIGNSAYALSAEVPSNSSGVYAVSYSETNKNGNLTSILLKSASDTPTTLPIVVIPDKCAFSQAAHVLWCASNALDLGREGQNDWYKGLVAFADLLWKVEVATGKTTLLDNITEISGRDVDVIDLKTDQNDQYLLFKNKRDDTLWLRRLGE